MGDNQEQTINSGKRSTGRKSRTAWDEVNIDEDWNIDSKDKDGRWIVCKACKHNKKEGRLSVKRPFNISPWCDHIQSASHRANAEKLEQQRSGKKPRTIDSYWGKKTSLSNKEATASSSTSPGEAASTSNVTTSGSKKILDATFACPGILQSMPSNYFSLFLQYGLRMEKDPLKGTFKVELSSSGGRAKLLSINCTGKRQVEGVNKKKYTCCEECKKMPFVNFRERISRMQKIEAILHEMDSNVTTESGQQLIDKFLSTRKDLMNDGKKKLLDRCRSHMEHLQWIAENKKNLDGFGIISTNGQVSRDNFIFQFVDLYRNNKHFQESLVMGLVKMIVARSGGHVNAPASKKMISFCQVLYNQNRQAYRIFRNNFAGYNESTIKRQCNALRPDTPIIDITNIAIRQRASLWLQRIRAAKKDDGPILVSSCLDATKVPAKGEYCQPYKCWVGGVAPDHYILDDEFNEENFVKLKKAKEIKVGLLTLQNAPSNVSQMFIVSARPQTTNEHFDEYNMAVLNCLVGQQHVFHISQAFDGLSAERQHIVRNITDFMNGAGNVVVQSDANHAAKAIRSQLVLGSSISMLGRCLFDVGLLNKCRIAKELYRVEDFSSDEAVLKLCSADTIDALVGLINEEAPLSILGTSISLYMLRMFLTGINASTPISRTGRATMLYSAVMWFNTMSGISPISKHNLTTAALGGMFLAVQKAVTNLRMCTSEPIEHTFGTTRQWRREFTISEFVSYSSKLQIVMDKIVENGFFTATSTKGYMAGFEGFVKTTMKMTRCNNDNDNDKKVRNLGAVDVDYYSNTPIAHQIERTIITIIRDAQGPMNDLMKVLGADVNRSPFNKEIESMAHLSRIYNGANVDDNYNDDSDDDAIWTRQPGITNDLDTDEDNNEINDASVMAEFARVVTLGNSVGDIDDEDNAINVPPAEQLRPPQLAEVNDSFNLNYFYSFLHTPLTNDTIVTLLDSMSKSISEYGQKGKGSTSSKQKAMSLKERWWQVKEEDVEKNQGTGSKVHRNAIYKDNNGYYRVINVFKKSYNKWRYEPEIDLEKKKGFRAHVQRVREVHSYLRGLEQYEIKSSVDEYIGVGGV